MTPRRQFVSRSLLGMLGAWSVLCALASQARFPHFLFICEQVEAFYNGMADDAVVYHVMQGLVALLWGLGVVAILVGARVARTAKMRDEFRGR